MQDFINKAKNLFSSFDKKSGANNNISKNTKEVDPLEALSTLDQKSENIRKKTLNRVVYITLFLSIGMFILTGLVKFIIVMTDDTERKPIETKTEKVKLEINTFTKWQEIKDQEIQQLDVSIKNVDTNLTQKIGLVKKELKQDINNTTNKILVKIDDTQRENSEFVTSILNDIKKEIQKSEVNSKKYADSKTLTIEDKIRQIKENTKKSKNSKLDFSKLSLPKLPSNENKQANKTSNKVIVKKEIKYEEVEESIVVTNQVINFSTLDKNETETSTIPPFTIMPGFTKATIVTGAAVPTLTQAQNVSRPIWLSFSGETLIANNETMNIDECLLQAAATGDFASGVAEVRLSKISCSATNQEGQKFKLISPVKGWVYSETGQYGLKGRLISKEGTIIEKTIPLVVIEGLVKALENVGSSSNNIGDTSSLGKSFSSGAAGGSSKVLGKISDYYLKILESLNPVIEVKAGRQVVVAFAGGESLKFEKYTPVDVAYFEREDENE
jgi:conjugal transfer pilus assembly protein TraB